MWIGAILFALNLWGALAVIAWWATQASHLTAN
jgi:hypothetical protein